MRSGPKPVRLPADAVRELERMADVLDAQSQTWPKSHSRPSMVSWLKGMRRGLSDAAMSCRRRAGRIRLAIKRKKCREETKELRELRRMRR